MTPKITHGKKNNKDGMVVRTRHVEIPYIERYCKGYFVKR